ncbi:ABC transporter permease [Eubacterium sp. AB3007]|uniref:ABC transporter permease n=1 Tax=Eubacterium sp. AB3007 TaxID=1392487 RepID=UPI000482506D|nr:ABC transporter permease [Eubacterium sp. AB3007]
MSRKFLAAPFLVWMLGGTLIPLCLIMYYGFTDREGQFTLRNITAIAEPVHAEALALALLLALASTIICFLIAFPLALILKDSRLGKAGFMVFIFILPMWMNFLLRTMAWQVILEKEGLFDTALSFIGLSMPQIINTPAAVVLGMVYDFLPFMILPIYNALMKLDDSIIEAAYDLGAEKPVVLGRIVLPLIVPGIASGVTMVFVPSLTTFVISNILGGGKIYLIGNIIEQEFTTSANWNLGSGLSLVMMVFVLGSMAILSALDKSGEGVSL